MNYIKHSANVEHKLQTQRETTFLVKSATPFISAIKKLDRILTKYGGKRINFKYQNGQYRNVKFVTVKGMGKAIEKTVSIGLHYKLQGDHKVDILTGSVEVLDELLPTDEDDESTYKKRMVSYVEIRIWIR